jgi:hypothetical protein
LSRIPYILIDPNELPDRGFMLLDVDGQSIPVTLKVYVAKNDFGYPTPGVWFKYAIEIHQTAPDNREVDRALSNKVFNHVINRIMGGYPEGEYEGEIKFVGPLESYGESQTT